MVDFDCKLYRIHFRHPVYCIRMKNAGTSTKHQNIVWFDTQNFMIAYCAPFLLLSTLVTETEASPFMQPSKVQNVFRTTPGCRLRVRMLSSKQNRDFCKPE